MSQLTSVLTFLRARFSRKASAAVEPFAVAPVLFDLGRLVGEVAPSAGAILIVGGIGAGKTVAAALLQEAFAAVGQQVSVDDDTLSASEAEIVTMTGLRAVESNQVESRVLKAQAIVLLRDPAALDVLAAALKKLYDIDGLKPKAALRFGDLEGVVIAREQALRFIDIKPYLFASLKARSH